MRAIAMTFPTEPGQSWNRSAPASRARTPCLDNRRFINVVFQVSGTGTPCRQGGTEAKLLGTVSGDPDLEWLTIDSSYVKVHQHVTGQ